MSDLNNPLPSVPSAMAVYTKSAEFPTHQVVVQFSVPSPSHATTMHLVLVNERRQAVQAQVQVPPNTTIDGLCALAVGLTLPEGAQAIKGKGPDAGSVLFLSKPGALFGGFRLHVEAPASYQAHPEEGTRMASWWGNEQPQFATVLN